MINSRKNKSLAVFLLLLVIFFVTSEANADTLGQKETFFVNPSFDQDGRSALEATLHWISDKLYIYIEDRFWNNLTQLERNTLLNNVSLMASEFENSIYKKEVQFWGSEPNLGVNGDVRITLLLEMLTEGTGGYFDSSFSYSKDEVANSNAREMLAINAEVVRKDVELAKRFLAHELQHLISFNQKELINKVSEEVWLNELRSEYSLFFLGYHSPYRGSILERRVKVFMDDPSDSLVEWPNTLVDYAIVNIFGMYLAEQYGASILSDTLRSNLVGISSINDYLTGRGLEERFTDIFGRWMVAMYMNNIAADSRFGFFSSDLRNVKVKSQEIVYLSGGLSEFLTFKNIKPWQPVWVEFLTDFKGDTSKSVKIDASIDGTNNFPVYYLAFYGDGTFKFGEVSNNSKAGSAYILNSDKLLTKVVVMATNGSKTTGFGASEKPALMSLKASILDTAIAKAKILKDGALIKRKNGNEIYVIWGGYKRYLPAGVISLYGHLDASKAIEVEPRVFNSYQTSNYVKYVDREEVYALWPDETKHWMNITPRQWDDSGRDWNAVFVINDLELDFYSIGQDIIR